MNSLHTETKCWIWRSNKATQRTNSKGGVFYDNPRTGGQYAVAPNARNTLGNHPLSEDHAIRLTFHLVQQRRAGIKCPVVTNELLNRINTLKRPRPIEMPDLLLQFLDSQIIEFAEGIAMDGDIAKIGMAWTGCKSSQALGTLMEDAREKGWVEGGLGGIVIRINGYARLEKINSTNTDSGMCFVAMWFDPRLDDLYEHGIAKGIVDAGYEPLNVGKEEHSDKIDDFIIASIRRARFVVADFTFGKTGPRGGVYYEAGFAKGLGLPVIWTVREDMINCIHFDTRQYNHIKWKDAADLRQQLSRRISAEIGDGPYKSTKKDPGTSE